MRLKLDCQEANVWVARDKGGGSHEVNRRVVLASHQFGYAGLTQFCAGMNFPPPIAKKAYNQRLIQIEAAVKNNAEEIMKDAAKRLKEKGMERPDDIEKDGAVEVARVAVTVDGTWQKRSLIQNGSDLCYFS